MANRKARRKQKNNLEKNVVVNTEEESTPSVAKISLLVVGIFLVFYVISVLLTGDFDYSNNNNTDDTDDDDEIVTIQYDEILAGETFNMNYQEYYVMFMDFEDKSSSVYTAIISKFKTANTSAKVFKVDLAKGFNASYVGETSNHNASTSDDLKIKGPTLIKIKDGKNVTYVEGKDAIKEILK